MRALSPFLSHQSSCCLWAWAPPPASSFQPALLTQDLGLLWLVGVPRGAVPVLQPPARLGPLLSPCPVCSWPRGRGRKGCRCTAVRVGLALQAVGLQLQTPKHILWEVEAWPAAGAFHYFGDTSLNMLHFLQPQLRAPPEAELSRSSSETLEECSALGWFLCGREGAEAWGLSPEAPGSLIWQKHCPWLFFPNADSLGK